MSDIVFEKNKKFCWDSKQKECLCRSSRPKGSLKKRYEKFRRIHKKTYVPESLDKVINSLDLQLY